MVKKNIMKQTEIGLLPEDWNIIELVDVLKFGSGRDYKHLKKGDIPVFGTGGLMTFVNEFLYDGDSVGIGRKGTIDKPLFLTGKFWTVDTLFFTHSFQNTIPKYIYYQFGRIPWKEYNEASGVPSLNKNTLEQIQIPLPPLGEQEAIAEALSDCDSWIESFEKVVAKKRLIKQGAMQELLTPKEDWKVKKLGDIIDVFRGGSPRPIQKFVTDKNDGINWIKIGDTSSSDKYIVETKEKIIPEGENFSRKVFKGDFLLSNSMSFGRPYILKIDGCVHDGWLVLSKYQDTFTTEFLYYFLLSKTVIDQYKSKAAGSGVLNLNKVLVSSVELSFPSLSEQTRIATVLSDMDAELEALVQKLNKARQIKQGMMQELLTGRVRLINREVETGNTPALKLLKL